MNDFNKGKSIKVAVLIVLYNSVKHIERLSKSLNQQQGAEILFFAFDNASTDGSLDELSRKLSLTYSHQAPENKGYAYANNHLVHQALQNDVDFLFVINPDMDFAPDVVFKLAQSFKDKPALGAVGPVLLYGDETGRTNRIQSCGMQVNFRWRTYKANFINADFESLPSKPLLRADLINGGSIMLRKETLDRERVFDECYFLYGEEFDLAHRLSEEGWESAVVTTAVGWHFHDFSKSNKSGYSRMYYYITRARMLYFRKYKYPISAIFTLLREILIFPLRYRWALKLSNPRMLRYYYLGMVHGLIGKSGEAPFTFKS